MSREEDYLDGLLGLLGEREQGKTLGEMHDPMQGMEVDTESEDAFLHSFEQELSSEGNEDDFMRQLEQELDAEESSRYVEESDHDDLFFDNLDGLVNDVKEQIKNRDKFLELHPGVSDIDDLDNVMVDTIGSLDDEGITMPDDASDAMFLTGAEEAEKTQEKNSDPADETADENRDMMDLWAFSDTGSMLQEEGREIPIMPDAPEIPRVPDMPDIPEDADAGGDDFADFLREKPVQEFDMDAANPDERISEAPVSTGKKRGEKAKKKMEKDGEKSFIQKISHVLFGEDEQEQAAKVQPIQPLEESAVFGADGDMSDENLEILQTLEGGGLDQEPQPQVEAAEDLEEKKKREKQEKKAKEKAEKKAKREAAKKERAKKKAKKEKRPKAPVEPDRTPPLPRVPVMLVFIMAGSLLALVIVGTNLFGYSNSMANAGKDFDYGNYEAAFAEIAGMEPKEQDLETYEKYRIMANVASGYSAYQSFVESGIYDMALDSLIRTIGRCERYSAEAQTYGCAMEMELLRGQAVGALGTFGIDEARALALYEEDDREAYSTEVYAILAGANLME